MTKLSFEQNVSLKQYTTYQIGGLAKEFCTVHSEDEMREAILYAKSKNYRFIVLGKGSNTLFDDRGFEGLVILNKIDTISWEEARVIVGGGYSFSLLGMQTARRGLSGLEFAGGIPGSVGGAIFMNAGANQREVKDSLLNAVFMTSEGEKIVLSKDEIVFGYRTSSFQKMKGAIIQGTFTLSPLEGSREKQHELLSYRKETQPYKDRSCGCVFRNPDGASSGKLIDECGLKGMQIGGAQVSLVHANFIVNAGGATASDVLKLIAHVQCVVKEKKQVLLEPEVRYISPEEAFFGSV